MSEDTDATGALAQGAPVALSVVFTGRNDNYSGNFTERALAALARNQSEACEAEVPTEWLFVEWNPLSPDYLSYELALKNCRCFVVDPGWHTKLIAPEMSFSQSFAKNVGIRRATGEWILVTNADVVFDDQVWANIEAGLFPDFLYRAERCDVDWRLFDKPFSTVRMNVNRRHASGGRFTYAAGDFLLFPATLRFGFDEGINNSDIYTDGRFCENWSALRSNGVLGNKEAFRFIGDIFKADHALTFTHSQGKRGPNPKGRTHWNYRVRTCPGPALYENKPDWGLRDAKQRKLREGVWYLDC